MQCDEEIRDMFDLNSKQEFCRKIKKLDKVNVMY